MKTPDKLTVSIKIAASVVFLLISNDASADDITLGLGVGVAPEYLGSKDHVLTPLPSASISNGPLSIRTNNLGLEGGVEVMPNLTVGVIGRVDPGRNALFKVNDVVVAKLRKVNTSIEAGGFMEFRVPLSNASAPGPGLLARIAAEKGLGNGHGGLLVETSLGLFVPLGPRTALASSIFVNWQDRRYADAFFGVDAGDAAATGLSRFTARSGVRDLGVSLAVDRQLGANWSGGIVASAGRLQSSALASPIVQERGNPTQLFAGLIVSRTF
jgi:outer membrane protein